MAHPSPNRPPLSAEEWGDLHAAIEVARRAPTHEERVRLFSVVMQDLERLVLAEIREYVKDQPWVPECTTVGTPRR